MTIDHQVRAMDVRARQSEATTATLNGRLAEANEWIDTPESAIARHIATAQIDAGDAQIGAGPLPTSRDRRTA